MNATQWVGIVAFGIAALFCFGVRRSPWRAVGAVNSGFAIECAIGLRHRVHDIIIEIIGPLYADRATFQFALIVAALLAVGGTVWLLLRKRQQRPRRAVMIATLPALTLFSIESISVHSVDAVLYRPAAGLLVIGWIWIALGFTTITCAIKAMFEHRNLKK